MAKIELSATAYKWLKSGSVPEPELGRIKDRVMDLAEDPRPPGCEKMKGMGGMYFRVRQGNYRVVYELKDAGQTVVVVAIGHRREIYRKFKQK